MANNVAEQSVRRSAGAKLHWNEAINVGKRKRNAVIESSLTAIKSAAQLTSAQYDIFEGRIWPWRRADT